MAVIIRLSYSLALRSLRGRYTTTTRRRRRRRSRRIEYPMISLCYIQFLFLSQSDSRPRNSTHPNNVFAHSYTAAAYVQTPHHETISQLTGRCLLKDYSIDLILLFPLLFACDPLHHHTILNNNNNNSNNFHRLQI